MLRRLVLLVLVCTSALAFAQTDAERAAEQTIFTLLNGERTKLGLPALDSEPRLVALARQHSQLLAQHERLSHQFEGEPDLKHRFATTDLRWNFIGENVADATSAEEAHAGLMSSPPHRENILDPRYNAVGIGVVIRDKHVYVTQDFAHRLDELSNADAENKLAAQFLAERKKDGIRVTRQFDDPSLRTQACDMARRDSINTAQVSLPRETRNVVTFTTGKLDVLPSTVERLVTEPGLSQFSVGACFARSSTYPEGTYWVIMAFQ